MKIMMYQKIMKYHLSLYIIMKSISVVESETESKMNNT